MADFSSEQALATELISENGFVASIKTVSGETDPVTGEGASLSETRTVNAVKLKIERKLFADELTQAAMCMLLCDGPIQIGETWLDGADERPVTGVMVVEPDNASHIISKALIGA